MDAANGAMGTEHVETLIIGGGQTGLAAGYYLSKKNVPFLILDANPRVGDAWRNRWDSLRLFTPARYNGLPGFRFPARGWSFPTKDEMGDYLESYAERFRLPVQTQIPVTGLAREGDRFVVTAGDRRFEASNVVVSTGAHTTPKIPAFAHELHPSITQLHSSAYRNASQLREGGVLLVGAGNSGAEIAFELARSHMTRLAGKSWAEIPVRHGGVPSRFVVKLVRLAGRRVLTLGTPIGRKVRPKFLAKGAPLIRIRSKELATAGVERVPRVVGVRDGYPLLEDGRVLEVENVIWCTGFRYDFPWIDLPIFGADGAPVHDRGVVRGVPGLYFLGLVFQYRAASDVLVGVTLDAAYLADHIAAHRSNGARAARAAAASH